MQKFKTIGATFPSSDKVYHYFVPVNDEPKVGDFIVTSVHVDSKNWTLVDAEPRMATVTEVHDFISHRATRLYLKLISKDSVEEYQNNNKELVLTEKKRQVALQRLDSMLKEEHEKSGYRWLAERNSEAAELLKSLEE